MTLNYDDLWIRLVTVSRLRSGRVLLRVVSTYDTMLECGLCENLISAPYDSVKVHLHDHYDSLSTELKVTLALNGRGDLSEHWRAELEGLFPLAYGGPQ